jgi:sRNA-binding regulator protein Hfq
MNPQKNGTTAATSIKSKAPVQDTSQYWGVRAKEFYASLRDKPITIIAMDGKTYKGVLVGYDQYDIAIRPPSGLTLLLAKHAIQYVQSGATNANEQES